LLIVPEAACTPVGALGAEGPFVVTGN